MLAKIFFVRIFIRVFGVNDLTSGNGGRKLPLNSSAVMTDQLQLLSTPTIIANNSTNQETR